MTTEKMTPERLRAVVESYGTSPPRWPAAEREAAAALLAESAAARALVTDAAPLDELLDAVPAVAPTPAMRAAILSMAPRVAPRPRAGDGWRALIGELGGWRLGGAVLAASLVLGIVSGGWLSTDPTSESSPDLLQLALLDDSATEY